MCVYIYYTLLYYIIQYYDILILQHTVLQLGRVHTRFDIDTLTGRLSSKDRESIEVRESTRVDLGDILKYMCLDLNTGVVLGDVP